MYFDLRVQLVYFCTFPWIFSYHLHHISVEFPFAAMSREVGYTSLVFKHFNNIWHAGIPFSFWFPQATLFAFSSPYSVCCTQWYQRAEWLHFLFFITVGWQTDYKIKGVFDTNFRTQLKILPQSNNSNLF